MDQLSPTLLCDFFALSLTLWNHSPVLRQHPQPDPQFIWNLAVEALQHDFVAPGLSTVSAVLLDLTGRPVSSVLGNTLNNARAVALAQTLGLHRNPSDWQRPESEKSLRIRLWWAVLIHDRWYVFQYARTFIWPLLIERGRALHMAFLRPSQRTNTTCPCQCQKIQVSCISARYP